MTQSRTFKTALLSISSMMATLGALAASMVLARLFTKEDYATYKQTMLVFRFVVPLLALGLPQAIYYFMPNEPDKRRNILANNIAMLGIMALLFSSFLFLGGNRFLAARFNNPGLEQTLFVVAFLPLIVIPFQSGNFMACMMVCNRVKLGALVTVMKQALPVAGVILAAFIWRTPLACVSGYVIGAAVMLVPSIWILLHVAKGGRLTPSLAGMGVQLKFALPLVLATMAGLLSRNLDKVLVSNFFDPEVFAVYVNGAMQLPLIGILTGSATAVLLPDMRRMFKEGKYEEGLELWKRSAVKCALILLPLMGFLMVMAPEIMTLLYGAQYVDSAIPFRIYLLLLPVRIAFFGTIFISAGKSNLILIRTIIGLLLNIILSIILLRVIGYLGAAVATVIVTYLWSVAYCMFWIKRILNKKYGHLFPFLPVAKILLAVLTAGIPVFFLNVNLRLGLLVRFGICWAVYSCCLLIIFICVNIITFNQVTDFVKEKVVKKGDKNS